MPSLDEVLHDLELSLTKIASAMEDPKSAALARRKKISEELYDAIKMISSIKDMPKPLSNVDNAGADHSLDVRIKSIEAVQGGILDRLHEIEQELKLSGTRRR